MKIIPRSFYMRATPEVARDLLGKKVVRVINDTIILSGIIVETEAYEINDPACHAFRGQTTANRALFETVGHAYIYFIYGNHFCLNVVAREDVCKAGGVLIRALEPVDGIEIMKQFRPTTSIKNLTNGPGKLAQALHITKELYGVDVTHKGPLYIVSDESYTPFSIISGERIGISKGQEVPWRFYIKDNPFVSRR